MKNFCSEIIDYAFEHQRGDHLLATKIPCHVMEPHYGESGVLSFSFSAHPKGRRAASKLKHWNPGVDRLH
jgi:hypothetical protein